MVGRILVLSVLLACACQASSFTHFTGTSLPSGWTTSTSGEGVVCMNGTLVAGSTGTCPSAVSGETHVIMAQNANAGGTLIMPSAKIDKSKSQLWLFSISRDTGSTSHRFLWVINSASTPAPALISTFEANARLAIGFGASNTLLTMDKWDGSHVKTGWDSGTNTWVTTPTTYFVPQASLNSYYVIGLEIDGPGARWRVISFTKNQTGFGAPLQGSVLSAMTDWVLWSNQETSTDLWMCFGYGYTNASFPNNTRMEWVYHADGAQQHSWTNGKTLSGSQPYRIKHNWGYVGSDNVVDIWLPEDRTTLALNVGGGGTWDADTVKDPSVVQDGSTYYMTYSGNLSGSPFSSGIASASDPAGTWTKAVGNPILPSIAGGNEHHTFNPQLVHDLTDPNPDKRWKIIYNGGPQTGTYTPRVYMASCAGPPTTCTWTRSNLILDTGPAASTISASPTGVSQSGTTVTITTTAAHGIPASYVGTPINISGTSGCSPAVDGAWTLASVPAADQVTFTHSQSATQTCGSGNLYAYDSLGWWRAHVYHYHGRWWMIANADAGVAGSRRTTYLTAPNLSSTFTRSNAILMGHDPMICYSNLTANVTASRTVAVVSTSGCQADDAVVFDQDTTTYNLARSRILRVVSGTEVQLYHQLDGLTTTTPAKMTAPASFGQWEESSLEQDTLAPSTFWMRTTCFNAYPGLGATIAGHHEDTCLYKSTTGITGPYTLQRLWNPHVPFHDFAAAASFINSNENVTPIRVAVQPAAVTVRRRF